MATIDTGVPQVSALVGRLVGAGSIGNRLFDASNHPDGLFDKWAALRQRFARQGVLLTATGEADIAPAFELHLNAQRRVNRRPAYVILSECHWIHPPNGRLPLLQQYRLRFGWNDELCTRGLATKIQLGFPLGPHPADGFAGRPLLCCLIAANKALPAWHRENDLYRERVRTIRWFEAHALGGFKLFGQGWNLSAKLPGLTGRIVHRIERALPIERRPFPSWCGTVARKHDVLAATRFCICYENVGGLPGYITEKIFDAFTAGCVPVYWGAPNVQDYIPAECFIDRRAFASHEELYAYLKGITEKRYREYQEAIRAFLESPRAYPFSAEAFAETVVTHIVADLKELGVVG